MAAVLKGTSIKYFNVITLKDMFYFIIFNFKCSVR